MTEHNETGQALINSRALLSASIRSFGPDKTSYTVVYSQGFEPERWWEQLDPLISFIESRLNDDYVSYVYTDWQELRTNDVYTQKHDSTDALIHLYNLKLKTEGIRSEKTVRERDYKGTVDWIAEEMRKKENL